MTTRKYNINSIYIQCHKTINEYKDSYLPYWLFTQQQSEKELVNCYYFKYKCFSV